MPIVMVRPMPKPAMALKAPFSSMAVAKTTSTRKKVVRASRDIPAQTGKSRASSGVPRSEEHTSELQSRLHLVCRLLLEKKKNNAHTTRTFKYSDSLVVDAMNLTSDDDNIVY